MKKEFKVNEYWRSRDGSKWRVLATDKPGEYSLVAMGMDDGNIVYFLPDGRYERTQTGNDLIEPWIDEPKKEWVEKPKLISIAVTPETESTYRRLYALDDQGNVYQMVEAAGHGSIKHYWSLYQEPVFSKEEAR